MVWVALGVLLLQIQMAGLSALAAPATIKLVVLDYDTKAAISEFTYLVNLDNAADPHDPDPMQHPALAPMPSYSPIVAAGDQTTAGSIGLESTERYLISVRAPGYKQWGNTFATRPAGRQ